MSSCRAAWLPLRAARQVTFRPGGAAAAAAPAGLRPYHGRIATAQRAATRPAQQILPASPPVSGIRRYSQPADGSSHSSHSSKIWDFNDIQRLTQDPKPNVVIVDVREPGELQSTGRIPHAVNIPVTSAPDSFHIADEEFEDRFGRPRPAKDQEVVFYCKAGVRSRAAAGLAREAGWTRVGEYPGSWLEWTERGGKVEK